MRQTFTSSWGIRGHSRAALCGVLTSFALLGGCPGDGDGGEDTLPPTDTSADTAEAPDTLEADTFEPDTVDPPDTFEPDTLEADTLEPDTLEPDTAPADVWIPPRCGDGHVDFGEECDDGDEANSDTVADACRTDCRDARCGDGVVDTGEDCDDANANDFDGCTAVCEVGPVVRAPAPGDLVIAELMVNPDAVSDARGEWIELTNVSPDALNLAGCVVHDEGTDAFTLDGPGGGLLLEPGAQLVLGLDGDPLTNGGVDVDFVYTTMLLENAGDDVILTCGEVAIDRVTYDALSWPLVSGQSLSLDPTRADSDLNDDPGSWCPAVVRYGLGDLGTPGAENPACFQLDTTVDACRVSLPAESTAYTHYPFLATVEVSEFGVTNLTTGVDVSPNLIVELGAGPFNAHPDDVAFTELAFTFAPAEPTPGWVGGPDHYDGYQREFVFDEPTTLAIAGRASRDGGLTWTLCDRTGGAYFADDQAYVSVLATPCAAGACASPDPAVCAADGLRLDGYAAQGACRPTSPDLFTCDYEPVTTDCGALGQLCEAGACGSPAPAPTGPGDVVITELMIAPTAVERADGQWIELYNPGDVHVNLAGCEVTVTPPDDDDPPGVWALPAPLVIPPKARRVVGASADPEVNGGAPVALGWGDALELPIGAFTLALSCGDLTLDEVPYGSTVGWLGPNGTAFALSPFRQSAEANDVASSWCLATATYGDGDRGTPGAANASCPGDVAVIDSCRLLDPATVTVPAGVPTDVVVRIIEPPITTRTVRTDVDPQLVVRVGYGAEGVRPGDVGWTWLDTEPDLAWIASSALGFSTAEDRYLLRLAAPAPGTWDFLALATADGGNTWAVCDLDGLVGDEDEPAPKQLVTEASPCWPDPCGAAPGLACEELADGASGPATVVLELSAPAVCTLAAADDEGDGDDEAAECAWVVAVVEDCAAVGAECQAGACANFPRAPAAGDAVFSELMIIPATGDVGEWVEISNPNDFPLDLAGCVIESGPSESWTFEPPADPLAAVIAPRSAAVLARSGVAGQNGNVQPRAVYSGISLGNLADWVALRCGGELIDIVGYNVADDWPVPVHQALALSGNRLNAAENDFHYRWCVADAATPNAINPLCPPEDTELDDCVIVEPEAGEVEAGEALEVAGRLLHLGVTDVQPGIDLAPGTVGQVGYGPVGTDPESAAWRWLGAAPDGGWTDAAAPGYDQWSADLVVTEPGAWSVAYRFTADAGESWLYCDIDGADNGYDPAWAAPLTVTPTTCLPNPCVDPPPPTCTGSSLITYTAPGSCAEDAETGEAVCTWPTAPFGCAPYGGCDAEAGRCVNPPQAPAAEGDLVINEIMRDSLVTDPDRGEWFEVYNPRSTAFDLRGCVVSDLDGESFVIDGPTPVVVTASGHFVFAASAVTSANGSLANVGYAWGDAFTLGNTFDSVVLTCGDVEIDRVEYGWDWPASTGVAMQLHRFGDHLHNDDKDLWCTAVALYGGGNRGTPRFINRLCPGVTLP